MPVILYERQRQILDFISQYIQRNGFAPSLKDIAEAMGLSSLATVHEHLKQLQRKGVIKIIGKGKTRRMEIIDKNFANLGAGVRLPILGLLRDGGLIEAFSEADAFFSVAPDMISKKKRSFILQVKDDTLIDDGILEGDLLILEEDAKINNGEVIVALLQDNSAILRRFFRETTRVKLESVKARKNPIYVNKIKIQGRVISIIRRL